MLRIGPLTTGNFHDCRMLKLASWLTVHGRHSLLAARQYVGSELQAQGWTTPLIHVGLVLGFRGIKKSAQQVKAGPSTLAVELHY